MASHCEDCTACCTVFEVKEIKKEWNTPCKHLGKTLFGAGCTIYSDRPIGCQHYVCLWLDSQRRSEVEKMPEGLRPDISKVVMGWPMAEDREALYVYPLPGYEDFWQREPVASHLKMILARGGKVVVSYGDTRIAIKGDMAFKGSAEEFAQLSV